MKDEERDRPVRERKVQSHEDVMKWLREDVWPRIPPEVRGKPLTREEEDEILGYGPYGV